MIRLAANHREAVNQSQGVWDYISPSRLNLWLKCPLAWKLRNIDGIRTPPTPALFLGTRVHDDLEMSMTFESVAAELQLKQQAVELVWVYLTLMADANDIPLAVETTLQRSRSIR